MKIRKLINRIFGGSKVKTNDPSVKVDPRVIPTTVTEAIHPPVELVIQESLSQKHDREREEKIIKEENARR